MVESTKVILIMSTAIQEKNLETMFLQFMQQTSTMNESLVVSTQDVNNKLMMQGRVLNTVLATLEDQDVRVTNVENKLLVHMENELITPMQRDNIADRAKFRVGQFLQYPSKEYSLYSKTYFKDLYGFLRRNYGLMNKIGNTKSKDYDNVMNGMTDWHPNEISLKERADLNREFRGSK